MKETRMKIVVDKMPEKWKIAHDTILNRMLLATNGMLAVWVLSAAMAWKNVRFI